TTTVAASGSISAVLRLRRLFLPAVSSASPPGGPKRRRSPISASTTVASIPRFALPSASVSSPWSSSASSDPRSLADDQKPQWTAPHWHWWPRWLGQDDLVRNAAEGHARPLFHGRGHQ